MNKNRMIILLVIAVLFVVFFLYYFGILDLSLSMMGGTGESGLPSPRGPCYS